MHSYFVVLAAALAGAAVLPKGHGYPFNERDGADIARLAGGAKSEYRKIYKVQLIVAPEGDVRGCNLAPRNPSDLAGRLICSRFFSYKFAPARSSEGEAAWAALTLPVVISNQQTSSPPLAPLPRTATADVEALVSRLPTGSAADPVVDLVLTVDSVGKLTRCDVERSSGSPVLDQAGCRAAPTDWIVPIKDREGRAVSSVQSLSVAFKVGG